MNRSKPKIFEWLFGLAFIILYLFRGPVMEYSEGLPNVLKCALAIFCKSPAVGIGWCIGLGIRWGRYQFMSPQDQRDADRYEKDERNLANRGRAAYISLCVSWIVMLFFAIVLYSRGLDAEATWLVWLMLLCILIFELIYWGFSSPS